MAFALIRSKGPVTGDGAVITTKQLRAGIPAAITLGLMVEAALTGKLRRIDIATGEEVEVAEAITAEQRLKLLDTLVKKRLPDAKTAEVEEDRAADLDNLPVDPEDVKRMPLSQLSRVIEAQFERTSAEKQSPQVYASMPELDNRDPNYLEE